MRLRLIAAAWDVTDDEVRTVVPSFEAGSYVAAYDPAEGLESLVCVTAPDQALQFDTGIDAMRLWRSVGTPEVRSDGQPNRPLTAFTVEIAP